MRRINLKFAIIVFAFILGTNLTSVAFQLEKSIQKGNVYYQKGDFKKAIEEYSEVITEGYESASLYYNLGNAYYKLGKLGYAILYYEKALKLNPDDEDINYNLQIANAHRQDKIDEVPQIFLVTWWNSLLAIFTVRGWALFSAILFIFTILLIGVYLLTSTNSAKRISFILGSILFSFFVVTTFILFVKYNQETNTKYGVLLQNTVTVKQSPDDNSVDAFVIHEGLKFQLLDELDGWYKIKLPDGKVGWLHKNATGII